MTPGVVMYHTPQGIVYAPTTLQDASRSMFNFQPTPTALSLPQSENGQQIITIPIPVSLAAAGNSQVNMEKKLFTLKKNILLPNRQRAWGPNKWKEIGGNFTTILMIKLLDS